MHTELTFSGEAIPEPRLRLPVRLAILGGLFALELLIISVWLDAEVLRGRGALANLVHDWGAWSVRLGVAIVLGSLIFAESRGQNKLQQIAAECAALPVSWNLFAVHAGLMAVFVWLSSVLFHQGGGSNVLVFSWAVIGCASLGCAAAAMVPVKVWVDVFRATGDAWIYGLAAAVVGCGIGMLAQKLWLPLSKLTFGFVALMLRPFVPALFVDPAIMSIGTPSFHVEIAPECSGYEGMGLILAFSTAWLWFFRRQWRFPQALLLIPAGVALIWIANGMRIAGLILIGNAGAEQIALGGFHSQAGWIAFNAVAIGVCVLAQRMPALARVEAPVSVANPTLPFLMPFLTILGAAMIARALSSGFEWFYFIRVIAASGAIWYFRRTYKSLDWRFGWMGIGAGALVFAIWMILEVGARTAAPVALMQASTESRIAWIVLRVVGAVVLVPIAEELAFRGFLLRRLESSEFESVRWRTFSWMPFVVSSVAFGMLHGERWLAGTIAGAIFALVQIWRGRIGEAVAAHAVANALVAASVLYAGNWQLW